MTNQTTPQPYNWPVPLATLLAAVAMLYYRKADAFHTPQFWAEDGIWFMQQYSHGARSLFMEYSGYYHLYPRLIALIAACFRLSATPAIYNLSLIHI